VFHIPITSTNHAVKEVRVRTIQEAVHAGRQLVEVFQTPLKITGLHDSSSLATGVRLALHDIVALPYRMIS
jgi:hypothetical protein